MLQINIPDVELWDEQKEEFIINKGATIQLEHSLVSISKWEAKWNKPFLSRKKQTPEEMYDYIRCMTITQNVNPSVYNNLTDKNVAEIKAYMDAPMTATTFPESEKKQSREVITSELIYYWMISLNIPFECQKWHLNRLLTLIKVCNFKNTPPKKRSTREIMQRNAALNASRRKKYNTKG